MEGGEKEESAQLLAVKSLGALLIDSENPEKQQQFKKNAWKLFGGMLPAWLVPRKRNT